MLSTPAFLRLPYKLLLLASLGHLQNCGGTDRLHNPSMLLRHQSYASWNANNTNLHLQVHNQVRAGSSACLRYTTKQMTRQSNQPSSAGRCAFAGSLHTTFPHQTCCSICIQEHSVSVADASLYNISECLDNVYHCSTETLLQYLILL